MKGQEMIGNTGHGRISEGKKLKGIQDKDEYERKRNYREYRTRKEMKGQKNDRKYRTSLDIPKLRDDQIN